MDKEEDNEQELSEQDQCSERAEDFRRTRPRPYHRMQAAPVISDRPMRPQGSEARWQRQRLDQLDRQQVREVRGRGHQRYYEYDQDEYLSDEYARNEYPPDPHREHRRRREQLDPHNPWESWCSQRCFVVIGFQ